MAFISSIWQAIVNAVSSFDLIKFLEGADKFRILSKLKVLEFYKDMIYGVLIAAAVIIVIQTIATCIVFHKADIPWWKALIPISGTFNTYGLADCEVIFCFNLLLSVVFLPLMNADMPIAILTIYLLLMVVLELTFCCFLARTFGKGVDCAIGLFLLRPIYLLILAFDKSKYSFDGPAVAPIYRSTPAAQTAKAAPEIQKAPEAEDAAADA